MRHVRPRELILPEKQELWLPPKLFVPGLTPSPKIIGAVREVNPGSVSWTSAGTFYWPIPIFNTMTIVCIGAGGGGSGAGGYTYWQGEINHIGGAGVGGGYGQFYVPSVINLVAYGGTGGPAGSNRYTTSPMAQAAHGQGYNGDTNYYGSGASGGYYGIVQNAAYGTIGGYGAPPYNTYGGYGGSGGRADKVFNSSQLQSGVTATIVVQAGGGPGWQTSGYESGYSYAFIRPYQWPVAGGSAAVYVSWS